jgi:hypothetical protein
MKSNAIRISRVQRQRSQHDEPDPSHFTTYQPSFPSLLLPFPVPSLTSCLKPKDRFPELERLRHPAIVRLSPQRTARQILIDPVFSLAAVHSEQERVFTKFPESK